MSYIALLGRFIQFNIAIHITSTALYEILTNYIFLIESIRRAIAQAVSRWLPTAAKRVPARVRLCGICGGQSGTGAGFLRVLRFPLPIRIPPIAPQ
jgi:hypothetical protein